MLRRVANTFSHTLLPRTYYRTMSSASSNQRVASATWRCLSAHVPLSEAASSGRLIGRSSNAAGIVGDRLLVFSGENTPRVPIDDAVHVFDLKSAEWNRIERKDGQSWPTPRIGHAGTTVGSAFYISGGRTGLQAGDETLADLWRFDSTTNEWTQVETTGSKPPPLSYHVLASYGNNIYCFGGCTIDHGRTNGLWCLDTVSNEWSELSAPGASTDSAPCGRGGPGLAAFESTVYVGFGYNGVEEQTDLWSFDLAAKKWTRLETTGEKPTARSVTDLVALPGFGEGRTQRMTAARRYVIVCFTSQTHPCAHFVSFLSLSDRRLRCALRLRWRIHAVGSRARRSGRVPCGCFCLRHEGKEVDAIEGEHERVTSCVAGL
jgi:hypothetical protein